MTPGTTAQEQVVARSMRIGEARGAALCLVLVLGLVAEGGAAAQQAATHACARVADAVQRLACYDQAFPPPAETRAEVARKARSEFGLDRADGRVDDRSQQPGADLQDIRAVLARLDYSGSLRTFTLDNGQVWMQTEGSASGNVKVGETVRIRKAMFGSYMLVMPSGVALRVKRKR